MGFAATTVAAPPTTIHIGPLGGDSSTQPGFPAERAIKATGPDSIASDVLATEHVQIFFYPIPSYRILRPGIGFDSSELARSIQSFHLV